MGQRLTMFAAACAVAGVCVSAAPGSARRLPNWAAPQISAVVAHGLMATSVRNFHPNANLTQGTLASLVSGLQDQLGDPPVTASSGADPSTTGTTTTGTTTTNPAPTGGTTTNPSGNPSAPITMTQLDGSLVLTLGLKKAAKEFTQGARDAGVSVPGRFGTEVVARLLGLRTNHPAAQDFLELRPQDPATRAEAAYSAAQILDFGPLADSWQIAQVKSLADAFTLPTLTDWQRQILTTAFSKIGMPYVWGGTSSKRIAFKKLQPADVIFFGTKGPKSSGAQVFHTAIYVGNGWIIQSSGEGVALAPLSDWYAKKFAWGRRPLQEAGLE